MLKADAGTDSPLSPAAATGCHCWPEPFWRVLLELWVTFLACIKENSKRNKSYNDTQIPSSWSSRESSRMGSEACLHRADPRFVFSFNHSGKSYLILGRQYIWIRTGLKINTPKIFCFVCLFSCLNFDGVPPNHCSLCGRWAMSAPGAGWRCAPAPQSARRCPRPDAASSKSWQREVFALQSRRIPGSEAQRRRGV